MAELRTTIGQQTIIGTSQEIDALGDVPEKVDQVYGQRLEPYQVIFRDQADMPVVNTLGARAKGVWREGPRRVVMSRAFGTYPVPDVYGHESTHVLDSDYLGRPQHRAICRMMLPRPDGWHDLTIDPDQEPLYVNDPGEAFASYGAAAMLGVRPVYTTLYKRRVPIELWPQLRDVALALVDGTDPAQVAQLQLQLEAALSSLEDRQGRIDRLDSLVRVGIAAIDKSVNGLDSVNLVIRDLMGAGQVMRDGVTE